MQWRALLCHISAGPVEDHRNLKYRLGKVYQPICHIVSPTQERREVVQSLKRIRSLSAANAQFQKPAKLLGVLNGVGRMPI